MKKTIYEFDSEQTLEITIPAGSVFTRECKVRIVNTTKHDCKIVETKTDVAQIYEIMQVKSIDLKRAEIEILSQIFNLED